MDLIGSYHAMGYTIEAYFPEQEGPDAWTLWVVKDGRVVGEFTTRIVVDSVGNRLLRVHFSVRFYP